MAIEKLKTKFVTGAFVNDVKHFFKKINEIIDWINNVGSKSLVQNKTYDAIFTQSGTNNPVVTVLCNTTGVTFNWYRDMPGLYKCVGLTNITSSNSITDYAFFGSLAGTYQVIFDQTNVVGYISLYIGQDEQLWLEVYDTSFNSAEYSSLLGTAKFPIKLKVYN